MKLGTTTWMLAGIALISLAAVPFAAAAAPSGASAASAAIDSTDAQGSTSPISFYGHLFDVNRANPMPMNTQFPAGEEDFSAGYGGGCGMTPADVPDPTGVEGNQYADCMADPYNEVWFYTTPGFVQVKSDADFSYDKIHNERGLTKDTFVDTSQDIKASFYMSADDFGYPGTFCQLSGVKPYDVAEPIGCINWDPGYLPQWVVRAELYTGVLGDYGGAANTPPDVKTAFEGGKLSLIAAGESAPVDVISMKSLGTPQVYKFDVNLGRAKVNVIPKEQNYLVRFKWYSVENGKPVILNPPLFWNADSGEFYPPSVTIPVKNAFQVEMTLPEFVHEKLAILGIINTPWGSYDVNHDTIKLTVTNDKGADVVPTHILEQADFSVAHGAHYKPVNVTYVWDYQRDHLAPGAYSVNIWAENFQKSAHSSCTGGFTISPDGSPGNVTVGQCGVRTISEDQLNKITQGAGKSAGGNGADAATTAPAVPHVLVPIAAVPLFVIARRLRK
ncbi:MAG: hypothetical protein ACYDCK_00480 [Thermoplasmatota archaeon]